MTKKKTTEFTDEEILERIRLKKDVMNLIYQLNVMHPDFLDQDEALRELWEWKPNYFDYEQFKRSEYYEEGDEDAPFFSEAFLYNLLGKEDARALLSLINRAVGIKAGP